MASAVDSRLAYARLSAVAMASRLPTANRDSTNSYTTSWDTTEIGAGQNCSGKIGASEKRPRQLNPGHIPVGQIGPAQVSADATWQSPHIPDVQP